MVSCASSGSIGRRRPDAGREGVQHEAGEPRREDRVVVGHAQHGVDQLVGADRLRDVAARAGVHELDHVLGRVRHRQRQEAHVRQLARDARPAPPARRRPACARRAGRRRGARRGSPRPPASTVPGLADDLQRAARGASARRRGTARGRRRSRRAAASSPSLLDELHLAPPARRRPHGGVPAVAQHARRRSNRARRAGPPGSRRGRTRGRGRARRRPRAAPRSRRTARSASRARAWRRSRAPRAPAAMQRLELARRAARRRPSRRRS